MLDLFKLHLLGEMALRKGYSSLKLIIWLVRAGKLELCVSSPGSRENGAVCVSDTQMGRLMPARFVLFWEVLTGLALKLVPSASLGAHID